MEFVKCHVGDLICQRREKNTGEDLPICGISKNGFMPPKQQEADTSIYNVFYRNDFIFNPARMELNSIVFNEQYDKGICSSLYEVFYVVREDLVLPAYLGLWVKRDTFTRYCEFLGSGSAREYCRVANISEMTIELPDIEAQRKIVNQYKTIQKRMDILRGINDNLETALRTLYNGYLSIPKGEILPSGWEVAAFSKIATVVMGQSPDGEDCNSDGVGEALLNGPTEFGIYSPTPVQWTTNGKKHCENGDILFCVRGSTTGRMNWANQRYAIGRGLAAIRHVTDVNLNWFVKAVIENNLQEILSASTGSTFPNIGKDLLNGFKIVVPDALTLEKFGEKGNAVSRLISHNAMEVDHLLAMQKALLSRLSF